MKQYPTPWTSEGRSYGGRYEGQDIWRHTIFDANGEVIASGVDHPAAEIILKAVNNVNDSYEDVINVIKKNFTRAKDAPSDYAHWTTWEFVDNLPLIDTMEALEEFLGDRKPDEIACRMLLQIAQTRFTEMKNAFKTVMEIEE